MSGQAVFTKIAVSGHRALIATTRKLLLTLGRVSSVDVSVTVPIDGHPGGHVASGYGVLSPRHKTARPDPDCSTPFMPVGSNKYDPTGINISL